MNTKILYCKNGIQELREVVRAYWLDGTKKVHIVMKAKVGEEEEVLTVGCEYPCHASSLMTTLLSNAYVSLIAGPMDTVIYYIQ